MRSRVVVGAAVALILGLLLPALAVAQTGGATRLSITPTRPGTRSNVVVRFVEPTPPDSLPGQRWDENLQISGAARRGCASDVDRGLGELTPGAAESEAFAPARLTGRRWCAGVHRVTLSATWYVPCPVGTILVVCPQIVVVPKTLGTGSFTVHG